MNDERSPRQQKRVAPLWVAALLVLAALVATATSGRWLPETTVILVRHAERYPGPGDPSLTPEGAARAERLAAMLADPGGTPIVGIFSSEVKRTKETAAPLASKLGLPVTVVPARDEAALLSRLRAAPRDRASVVVGHSNTVPALVSALTKGRFVPALAEDDFGSIFVVHVALFQSPTVVRLRY